MYWLNPGLNPGLGHMMSSGKSKALTCLVLMDVAHVPEDLFIKNKLHRVVTYHFVILRSWEAQKCKFEKYINSS